MGDEAVTVAERMRRDGWRVGSYLGGAWPEVVAWWRRVCGLHVKVVSSSTYGWWVIEHDGFIYDNGLERHGLRDLAQRAKAAARKAARRTR